MNLTDKNLSLQLYYYLCDIIGSPDVVKTRRNIFTVIDLVYVKNATFISSGSKAEGLDLSGSDYDVMYINPVIRVHESLNDVSSASDKIIVHMDTDDTKPGFTKLKLFSNVYIESIHDWCKTNGMVTYISSKRFREDNLNDNMVIHGTCHSTVNGDVDNAHCLRCNEWIRPAQEWIHRSRTTWPHHTLVTAAVQYGVLFVPIGCKNSPNEDLQWRISFSVTEKLLIHSFSHTQLLCYALMNIILTDLIKSRHGDLLCSYFLKTLMFWLSEEISPSEWKPENMISCFVNCFRRLVYCVEYKTCLHYFITENNLFEDRFSGNDHKALMDTLRYVYGSPWTSVFHTNTFLNYRLQSINSNWMTLSASVLSCFSYMRLISNPDLIDSKFKRFGNRHNYICRKDMWAYRISVYARKYIQNYGIHSLRDRNKSFYKHYKRIFGYLKISLQSDSVSSWLLLASLFYKCERFWECLDIINYCLFSCTPDKIYVHYANSLAEQTVFKQMKQKWGLLHAMKYLIIENVSFQYSFSILPNELISLITDTGFLFPPVVYSYVLQFLCCHHLGDNRGKHNALHNLELTIRNQYLIFPSESILKQVYESLDLLKSLIR